MPGKRKCSFKFKSVATTVAALRALLHHVAVHLDICTDSIYVYIYIYINTTRSPYLWTRTKSSKMPQSLTDYKWKFLHR